MLAEWTESDEGKSHSCSTQEWGSGTAEFFVITSTDAQLLGPRLRAGVPPSPILYNISIKSL